jgi:hypothetical protein
MRHPRCGSGRSGIAIWWRVPHGHWNTAHFGLLLVAADKRKLVAWQRTWKFGVRGVVGGAVDPRAARDDAPPSVDQGCVHERMPASPSGGRVSPNAHRSGSVQ